MKRILQELSDETIDYLIKEREDEIKELEKRCRHHQDKIYEMKKELQDRAIKTKRAS